MNRPQPDEFGSFYSNYIIGIENDVISKLESQIAEASGILSELSDEKWNYSYAPGKWTIKEAVGHIIDTERIMVYRLTRIARHDSTPLPGFEQDDYVSYAHFNDRSGSSLIEEFSLLRRSNLFLFKSLTDDELNLKGTANGAPVSARALLFIIAGHLNHHLNILSERYL